MSNPVGIDFVSTGSSVFLVIGTDKPREWTTALILVILLLTEVTAAKLLIVRQSRLLN
jgi:hypothetical protein